MQMQDFYLFVSDMFHVFSLTSVHNIKVNTVIEIVNERKRQRGCTTARLKTDVALMFVKINVLRRDLRKLQIRNLGWINQKHASFLAKLRFGCQKRN